MGSEMCIRDSFNAPPKFFGISTELENKICGHYIKKESKRRIITPIHFSKKNISLKNIYQLKKRFNIGRIHILDRILGLDKNFLINDHINRSGISFLRGETPYNKRPMFPDLSKVYSLDEKKPGFVVQTLGPRRFKNPPNESGVIFSELAGILAVIWHYTGVEVICCLLYTSPSPRDS